MPAAVADYLLGASPRCAEFLDRGALERLIADYRRGTRGEHVHFLISILMLEIWLSTYVPRAVGASASSRGPVLVPG
jgi:hypothetical protein